MSFIRSCVVLLLWAVLAVKVGAGETSADLVDKLAALPDFKIEHLLKADPKVHGSWICLAKDNKGRLLLGGQRNQPVTRITIKDGQIVMQEDIKLPISEVMGMLYAFDSLYVSGFGKNKEGKSLFGFFRCKDTTGNGTYDSIEFLREWQGGPGEHGAHGIALGPDNKLYVVNGNFCKIPNDLLPSSPHRNYADDVVLPRAEDGNGFGAGVKPPGGYVVRMDADGKNAELYGAGQRNCYDHAFNPDGELFGFDSDMEWDWGTPWYRPVRVFQVTSGADHGYREGTAKWPEYYHDSLPATVNIGIGCPTGVSNGIGAKFPVKYQKAIYICDWTYGRLIAVHLKPDGAGYTGTWENFVAPKGIVTPGKGPKGPLNLTDVVIGDDGAMYFTVGGRGTGASLYRVTYTGNEPTTGELQDKEHAAARELRRKIEAFHTKEDPAAIETVWPHLNSPDRFIRYAARIAIERQPVEQWKSRALAEKQPNAALTALLSIARLGGNDAQPALFKALESFPIASLSDTQKFEKLRVIQVSIARQGKPASDVAKATLDDLNAAFPAKNEELNRELCQILLALEAPDAVSKTMALLNAAQTQPEQLVYILALRTVTKGWTPELRKQYFSWWTNKERPRQQWAHAVKWFEDAARPAGDGASFPKFLGNFHSQAKATLTADEQTALAEVLAAYTPPGAKQQAKKPQQRKFVKEWDVASLLPALDQVGKNRSFERGKEVFEAAQCLACHRFGNTGGASGPDLTAISSRFQRKDILESIIEPSKVISEQYQNMTVKTKDNKIVEGRVLEENDDRLIIQPNPLMPEKVEVKKANLASRAPSKLSPMPEALVNNFTKEEILDLLTYMESAGKADHPAFSNPEKQADVTAKVAAEVKNNKLSIKADNELFGDPAQGTPKKLRVEYAVGDESLAKTCAEGETIEISAPADKKLSIKRAVYGVIP
ncbi:MAG TPA: c-type cytochrome [Planctomycetota bacterium]|nr:c-type cytochrome [Planctomycetota bacterium]